MKNSIVISLLFALTVHSGLSQNFQDNLTDETMGDFPSNWDLVSGLALVDQQDGYKFISIAHGGIIKPIINGQSNNYLNGDFTVEFDAYFDRASNLTGQRFEIRLWEGAYDYNQGGIKYAPFIIARNGLKTSWSAPEAGSAYNYLQSLETLEPVWRHIKIECVGGKLKILLDEQVVLFLPRFKLQPSMLSIGGGINESKFEARIGITNISIKGNPEETFLVMVVDRQTNQVLDINTLENIEAIKKAFPNTKSYFGTIHGQHTVRPYDHSDIPKPSISSVGYHDTKMVRPHEHSDIPKLNFIASRTMSYYSIIPAKDAKLQFDLENGVSTETIALKQSPQINQTSVSWQGDYFETKTMVSSKSQNLEFKSEYLYVQPIVIEDNIGFGPIDGNTNVEILNPNMEEPAGTIDGTTSSKILAPTLTEKPIKLKVTLTDLLCIKKRQNNLTNVAKYNFEQSIDYQAKGIYDPDPNRKFPVKIIDNFKSNFTCISVSLGSNNSYNIENHKYELAHKSLIDLSQTGKRLSNVMNSIIFEITKTNYQDKTAKFHIKSYLEDLARGTGDDKLLYNDFIEVEIDQILDDLILLNKGEEISGYSTPYHDPEIMKAQYGLFKTFDSGPNGKLWVRQFGKTLEGPISLGNITSNNGLRGAAWIKFELLDY